MLSVPPHISAGGFQGAYALFVFRESSLLIAHGVFMRRADGELRVVGITNTERCSSVIRSATGANHGIDGVDYIGNGVASAGRGFDCWRTTVIRIGDTSGFCALTAHECGGAVTYSASVLSAILASLQCRRNSVYVILANALGRPRIQALNCPPHNFFQRFLEHRRQLFAPLLRPAQDAHAGGFR